MIREFTFYAMTAVSDNDAVNGFRERVCLAAEEFEEGSAVRDTLYRVAVGLSEEIDRRIRDEA